MHKKRHASPVVVAALMVIAVIAVMATALFGSATSGAIKPPSGGVQLLAGEVSTSAAVKLPPGQYPNGTVLGCVLSKAPYTLKSHAGKSTVPCPSGTQLITLKGPNKAAETGPRGATGPAGPKGDTGPAGADAQALPFGVGTVSVKRGTGAASVWAKVSTAISAAEGGTASNTFRMTCSAAAVKCSISAAARATVAGGTVYPRLLITKSGLDGKPVGMCEYADGTDNAGGAQTLTTTSVGLPLGIGGSLDCDADQVRPASGVVDQVDVGPGYYDIAATFSFTS